MFKGTLDTGQFIRFLKNGNDQLLKIMHVDLEIYITVINSLD